MTAAVSRYKRLRTIAKGGMGTVFLGRMEGASGFERLVAIKVMHAHLAEDPELVSMFLDEARLAASIRHPNVVSMLDVDTSQGGLSLVMEYVDGPSLQKLVRSVDEHGDKVPIEIVLRIMVDSLAGLHAAHELTGPDGQPAGLVHRDVSPQNILLGTDGVSRITDFGVARAEDRLSSTRAGEMKGKFAYMSIEQIRGGKIDRRCDVYAAGVVLWELLAGQPMVTGDSPASLMLAAATGPVGSPGDIDDRVPAAIDEVCMRALSKAPDDRWPTAAAFAEALEDAAASIKMRIARPRDVASLITSADEDGPTRLKPQAATEWMARIASARKSGLSSPDPAPPASEHESGVRAVQGHDAGVREPPQTPPSFTPTPASAPAPVSGPVPASASAPVSAPAPVDLRNMTVMMPRPTVELATDGGDEDDGPTQARPDAATEWIEHLARKGAAAAAEGRGPNPSMTVVLSAMPDSPSAPQRAVVKTAVLGTPSPFADASPRVLVASAAPAAPKFNAPPAALPSASPAPSTAPALAALAPGASSTRRSAITAMVLGMIVGILGLAAVAWFVLRR